MAYEGHRTLESKPGNVKGLLRASPIIENAAYLVESQTDGSLMDGAYSNQCQSRSRSCRSPGIAGRPSSLETSTG
jgi:hypothetical protein